jgi:hypothetical protein
MPYLIARVLEPESLGARVAGLVICLAHESRRSSAAAIFLLRAGGSALPAGSSLRALRRALLFPTFDSQFPTLNSMKPPTHFHRRAKECERYAIALAAMCGACAIGFACVDRRALTDAASFLPLMLASAGFATGFGCVNEFRESKWWRRMAELEAAYRPMARSWVNDDQASGKYDEDSSSPIRP